MKSTAYDTGSSIGGTGIGSGTGSSATTVDGLTGAQVNEAKKSSRWGKIVLIVAIIAAIFLVIAAVVGAVVGLVYRQRQAKKKEVMFIPNSAIFKEGETSLTFVDIEDRIKNLGKANKTDLFIASVEQVKDAQKNGAEWCAYGWCNNVDRVGNSRLGYNIVGFPMQRTVEGCGTTGFNNVQITPKFKEGLQFFDKTDTSVGVAIAGFNVYGVKPAATAIPGISGVYPFTTFPNNYWSLNSLKTSPDAPSSSAQQTNSKSTTFSSRIKQLSEKNLTDGKEVFFIPNSAVFKSTESKLNIITDVIPRLKMMRVGETTPTANGQAPVKNEEGFSLATKAQMKAAQNAGAQMCENGIIAPDNNVNYYGGIVQLDSMCGFFSDEELNKRTDQEKASHKKLCNESLSIDASSFTQDGFINLNNYFPLNPSSGFYVYGKKPKEGVIAGVLPFYFNGRTTSPIVKKWSMYDKVATTL